MNWPQFANMLGHIWNTKISHGLQLLQWNSQGDAHSNYILMILLIDWWNFRKLQEWFSEFEWDEDRTQNRKSNSLVIKTWNFSRMTILKPQNSASWTGSITNEIMLLYFYNVNKHEILLLPSIGSILTPIKPMSVDFAEIWQSYSYTHCTKTALKQMWSKRTITQTNF